MKNKPINTLLLFIVSSVCGLIAMFFIFGVAWIGNTFIFIATILATVSIVVNILSRYPNSFCNISIIGFGIPYILFGINILFSSTHKNDHIGGFLWIAIGLIIQILCFIGLILVRRFSKSSIKIENLNK